MIKHIKYDKVWFRYVVVVWMYDVGLGCSSQKGKSWSQRYWSQT